MIISLSIDFRPIVVIIIIGHGVLAVIMITVIILVTRQWILIDLAPEPLAITIIETDIRVAMLVMPDLPENVLIVAKADIILDSAHKIKVIIVRIVLIQ
jgi:hypothetical protein